MAFQKNISAVLFLFFAVVGAFQSNLYAANADGSAFSVDVTSARQYLNMAQKAGMGQLPDAADWDSLFVSPAYKSLLEFVHWDKEEFKSNVRSAFDIVYNPMRMAERDSIVGTLSDLSSLEDELPMFVSTAYAIRNNLDEYSATLNTLNIDSIVQVANARALDLVPQKGVGLHPQSSPIYFIVWDLECRALNGQLFLDVNTFFHDGLEAAIDALAHEMHHFYLMPVFESKYDRDINDGAAYALICNMREGVADIINKKQMPLTSLTPYGDEILALYNADYEASPQTLQQLDAITCSYLDGVLSFEKYFQQAAQCAHFEGHTTGDYMVFLIRDYLGLDAVVESVGDLDAFVDNYNKAAEKAGSYRFSDRFTNHIHAISAESRRR